MSEQRARMFERMGQELERVRVERDSMAGHLRDLRAAQEQLAGHYERIEAELERVRAERDAARQAAAAWKRWGIVWKDAAILFFLWASAEEAIAKRYGNEPAWLWRRLKKAGIGRQDD